MNDSLAIEMLLVIVLLFQGAGLLAYFLNRSLLAEARTFYTREREIHIRMDKTASVMQETVDDLQQAVNRLAIQVTTSGVEGATDTRTAIAENHRLLEDLYALALDILHKTEARV
jgi:hypothetical protein